MSHRIGIKERLWGLLGSRELSVFIFVMACTYALFLIIFATVVPLPWVNNIARLLPFKVLYLLFFVNLIICEIRWLPAIIGKCRRARLPETTDDLQRFKYRIEVRDEGSGVRRLEGYLRSRGYKIQWSVVSGQGLENPSLLAPRSSLLLYASKGRFSSIGNLLFHSAFIFILLGGWTGLFSSFDSSTLLMEGEEFLTSETTQPAVNFKVEKITPAYWGNELLFTDLKADVRYPYKGGIGSGMIRLSQALSLGGSKVTVSGIGFAPKYLLKDKAGLDIGSGFVKMNIFPPGTEDHLQISGYPHKISVSFYPDHEVKDGKVISRSMNPVNPAYYVKVFRNKAVSYSGLLKPGEVAEYEGLRLSFPEFKYWGMFRIVKNSGFVFIWIACVLFIGGLAWRFLFYKREVAVIDEGDGVYLYGSSEYYPKLFEDKLRSLLGHIKH